MDNQEKAFQYLDWKTPIRRVDWRCPWRVSVAGIVCTVLAIAIWHGLFPNTFWFTKLCTSVVTGGFVGLVVGCAWQFRDEARRARCSWRYSGWAAIGLFCFAVVSIFLWGPDLYLHEAELTKIRGLTPSDVVAISIEMPNQPPRRIVDDASIASFANQCRQSNLFYPSHEGSTVEFKLTIDWSNGTRRRGGTCARFGRESHPTHRTQDARLLGALRASVVIALFTLRRLGFVGNTLSPG